MESDASGIKVQSGISIRESQVGEWLRQKKFHGEYLLVSTKPDSDWSKRLRSLSPDTFLIVDLYTPVLLEKALTFRSWNPMDWMIREQQRAMVRTFLRRGNHFLVANRRQREYWLEGVKSLGVRLEFNDISVMPTGSGLNVVTRHQAFVPRTQPRGAPGTRHHVVLWFGGMYPWMDPEPLIRAFGRVHEKFPNWTLKIMGGFQPATGYGHRYRRVIRLARQAIEAKQLQIVEWKNTIEMHRYLKDVSFAVHLVRHTPEDYYAHRVRLLTLLNSGIGVLTSGRDVISDLLIKMKAGEAVKSNAEDVMESLVGVMESDRLVHTWSEHAPTVQQEFISREQSDARRLAGSEKGGVH